MPARASTRLDIALTTLTATGTSPIDFSPGRIVQVLALPSTMSGVELQLDDGDWWPISGPLKFQSAEGSGPFQRIAIRGPAQSGILTLFVGDDPVPLLTAAPGIAAAGLVGFELMAVRFPEGANGGPLPTMVYQRVGVDASASMPTLGLVHTGATGGNPQTLMRAGRLCARPNLGAGPAASAFYLSKAIPWIPRLVDALNGNATWASPDALLQTAHIEVELQVDALGGTNVGGVFITPSDGASANDQLAWGVNSQSIFGVLKDGAGHWHFRSRFVYSVAGPWDIDDDITAALTAAGLGTVPVRIHLQLQSANHVTGQDGIVSVFVNDILTKTYTDMSKFPTIQGNSVADYGFYRLYCGEYGADGTSSSFHNLHVWTSYGAGVPQQPGD